MSCLTKLRTMTEELCNVIKDNLTGDYIDRIEGAVTRVSIKTDKGLKYFPFTHSTATCTKDNAVIPDESFKSVIWFEPSAVKPAVSGTLEFYTCDVRMIGWLNLPKLGTNERSLTAQIEAALIGQMKGLKGTVGTVVNIASVQFIQAPSKSLSIFSKYSFNEDTPYYFGDFDFFAHDYRVAFTVSCTPTINDEIC